MMNAHQDWKRRLRHLLKRLCEIFNGAPCDLSESQPVSTWIAQINGMYQAAGCPPPSLELIEVLTELGVHLAEPGNDLSADDNAILLNIIATCGP